MRLVTYLYRSCARAGAVSGDKIIDLERAQVERHAADPDWSARRRARQLVPADLKEVIAGGEASLGAAREAVAYVEREISDRGAELYSKGVVLDFDQAVLLPPIPQPNKIICLGLNYSDHAVEAGMDLPVAPELFAKFSNSLIGHEAPIKLPQVSEQVDYEAELAFVIGRHATAVPAEGALDYVAGYTILNDVSVRDYQARTTQWLPGKSVDQTTPVGPWLVTADEIPDPQSLAISLEIDGEELQASNTSQMVFGIERTIEFVSSVISLDPGDVISTGTPHGVGLVRTPPRWLLAGESVTVKVGGIGELTNPVQAVSAS